MKNPLEKLLEAFQSDLRVARSQQDVKQHEYEMQRARVEQLGRAIERIEEHIERGKKEASEKMALEQQRALQGVAGGGMMGQGRPGQFGL